jgi:hypothetical protein
MKIDKVQHNKRRLYCICHIYPKATYLRASMLDFLLHVEVDDRIINARRLAHSIEEKYI